MNTWQLPVESGDSEIFALKMLLAIFTTLEEHQRQHCLEWLVSYLCDKQWIALPEVRDDIF